ncbi:hypothetical protein I3760_11G195900 [Carya illinoinensis]|nr:hypothetical protein I3760_11G195900 [Carya illinoinensis]
MELRIGLIDRKFAVDIHPGVKSRRGILLDHATGVAIREAVVIGNNVSIFHNVTLGGTGKDNGDRHPTIGDVVLIGAGTNVLGNVKTGEGATIGAGSVVLKEVTSRTTAVALLHWFEARPMIIFLVTILHTSGLIMSKGVP